MTVSRMVSPIFLLTTSWTNVFQLSIRSPFSAVMMSPAWTPARPAAAVARPRCRKRILAVHVDHGEIGEGVAADQPATEDLSAAQRHLDGRRALNPMVIRQDVAVGTHDHARARPLLGEDPEDGLHL